MRLQTPAIIMAVIVLTAAACGDDPPDPEPVPSTTFTVPDEVGYSGGVELAAVTPLPALKDASAKVEQAHEGIGNIIHHDDGNWDNNGCGVNCEQALSDAIEKATEACAELGPDVLGLYTWDNNQTVGHACHAALYWLGQTLPVDDATHHAEYQLGILRDVLRAEVQKRQG